MIGKLSRRGRLLSLMATVVLFGGVDGRTVTSLSGDGWMLDGTPVSVPHTWNAVDGCDGIGPMAETSALATSYARRSGTYRRLLPTIESGRRVFLRFEGVSVAADVRVNGREVGRHVGAFTAFELEITDALRPGTSNVLEVVADNGIDAAFVRQPISADFTVYGGLYRDVLLIETDDASFDTSFDGGPGVWITADPTTGSVAVETRLRNATDSARISFEVRERGGCCVATSDVPLLTVRNPRLWSPENPALYTLVARLVDGESRDEIAVDFGFRTVEIRPDGFYLNGIRRKLRGVNRHQDKEGLGWALTAADEAADIAWIRHMGADAVRTAHYPQSGNFYDLCDREGLLAWVEYPNVDIVNDRTDYLANARCGVREMIAQLRNHPSVFVWGLANELDTAFMARHGLGGVKAERVIAPLASEARSLDPSRATALVTCDRARTRVNDVTDALGLNLYPGWYRDRADGMPLAIDHMMSVNPGRLSVAVTEYGAGGSITQQGDPRTRNQPLAPVHSETYQAFVHHETYRALRADPRVWGSFVWAMFDFGSDARREGPRHGINDKGLVTFDRQTAKDAFYFYKANWNAARELHLVGLRMSETTNAALTVMAFANRGPVRLTVNGRDCGVREPDEVQTVFWDSVPLDLGDNVVKVMDAEGETGAVWRRVASRSQSSESMAAKNETKVWQAAIDAAAAKGGGQVIVPPGVHPVAQLELRSNVELHLRRGAVLEGLAGMENYPVVTLPYSEGTWSAVVAGFGVTNVAITGAGEIHGQGERFSMDYRGVPKGTCKEGLRPRGILLADSCGIRLEGFTLRDTGCWGIVLKCCSDVVARHVTVNNHAHHNNDGFDIEARNVLIEDCDIDAGDDALCIKSNTPDFRVENIVARRCVVRSHCNGMKLGTASHGTMRNIRFENCCAEAPHRNFIDRSPGREGRPAYNRPGFAHLPNGVGCSAICVECVDGGIVEDITYDGIELSGFQVPIFVRGGTRRGRSCGIPASNHFVLRNIFIRNVKGRAESLVPSSITGVDGCRPKNVVLENVSIVCRGLGSDPLPVAIPGPEYAGAYPEATMFKKIRLPAYGLFVDRADDVVIQNVRFDLCCGQTDFRPPIYITPNGEDGVFHASSR